MRAALRPSSVSERPRARASRPLKQNLLVSGQCLVNALTALRQSVFQGRLALFQLGGKCCAATFQCLRETACTRIKATEQNLLVSGQCLVNALAALRKGVFQADWRCSSSDVSEAVRLSSESASAVRRESSISVKIALRTSSPSLNLLAVSLKLSVTVRPRCSRSPMRMRLRESIPSLMARLRSSSSAVNLRVRLSSTSPSWLVPRSSELSSTSGSR